MRARVQFRGLQIRFVAAALALTAGASAAHASLMGSVTVVTAPGSGGLTSYTYTVTDLPSSTDNLGEFSLGVPIDANLGAITQPAGYLNDYTPGNVSISFESTDASLDLTPGESEMFSFLSVDKPGVQSYEFTDYNTFDTEGGTTIAPSDTPTVTGSPVPEPSSLLLLGSGLPIAAALVRRRRACGLISAR